MSGSKTIRIRVDRAFLSQDSKSVKDCVKAIFRKAWPLTKAYYKNRNSKGRSSPCCHNWCSSAAQAKRTYRYPHRLLGHLYPKILKNYGKKECISLFKWLIDTRCFIHALKAEVSSKKTRALEVKESVYGQWRTELKVPQPASKLSRALWRRGGKTKESL